MTGKANANKRARKFVLVRNRSLGYCSWKRNAC